ncbi:thiamine diphosphokinase [soil metagenome]
MMNVVIFSGGEPLTDDLRGEIPEGAYLIAADSGLDHAFALGLDVDLVVGDLDSVTPEGLERTHAVIERHSPDTAATDLDLAIQAGHRLDPDRIIVLGGHGGRIDHFLGSVMLVTADRWHDVDIEWVTPHARIRPIRGGTTLHGTAGTTLSLLAIGEAATGVTTNGLRWELADATLEPGSTRGVSNVFMSPVATIRVESGTLIAIQPDPA